MYRTKDQVALEIISEGQRRYISARGIKTALSVGVVESDLIVYANPAVPESMKLPHDAVGYDGKSVGPFQQQVVWGDNGWWWGDAKACMDPTSSAAMFYRALARLSYNNPDHTPGWFAQKIQKSRYPDRYDQRFGDAAALYDRLTASETNMPYYGITQRIHGYNPTTPADATGNSNGPRAFTNYVVIHTQEGDSSAVDLAHYCNDHQVSYNLIVDANDTVENVPVDEGPWAAADANNIGVHICFAGSFAAWNYDDWMDHDAALQRAAVATAAACVQYGIPAEHVQLGDGWPVSDKGIAGHFAFGARGGGHHDPGDGFPWGNFIPRVKRILSKEEPPVDALTTAEQRELLDKTRDIWDQLRGPGGNGWPQLDGRTPVDALADVALHQDIPGYMPPRKTV
jgi:hypothetical protein